VKKIFLPIFSSTLLFLIQPAFADFQQALSDFRYQLSEYAVLHGDYDIAKANYLKFKSLIAEKEAFEKTKKLLIARNKTLETYFFLLQETINQTQNIEKEDFESVSKKIKAETDFLKNQSEKLEESQIINQLETFSKELEAKKEEFQDLAEEATSLIVMGQLYSSYQSHQILKQKISQIVEDETQAINDKTLIKHWLEESERNAQEGLTRRNQAREILHQFIQEKGYKKIQLRAELEKQLTNSKKSLEDAVSIQHQVIRKII